MDLTITNGSGRTKAFRAQGGLEVVKPNQSRTLENTNISDEIRKQCEAEGVVFAPAEAEPVEPEAERDLETLRVEYFVKFEKEADKRWKVARLLEELAKSEGEA